MNDEKTWAEMSYDERLKYQRKRMRNAMIFCVVYCGVITLVLHLHLIGWI